MKNEKTTSIFRTEKDKEEFVRAFRKMTMSGAINKDVAIEKLIRENPNYFHQPTPDDIVKISRSEMNAEIRQRARAGVQSNRLADGIFANVLPTDKKPS
jgi:hypothetical protein